MGNKTSSPAEPMKEKVFGSTEGNGEVYRIPALLYFKKKDNGATQENLLAFAEKRRTADDSAAEALVMRTGRVKKDRSSVTVEWSDVKEVVKKKDLILVGDKRHRPMNPCPIYDESSNRVFLFFIGVEGDASEPNQIWMVNNKARLCYTTSSDAGETWSDVTDLTDNVTAIKDWSTFAIGPGHGIQTKSGRLIIPAYAYPSPQPSVLYGCLSRVFCCFNSWFCIKACCPLPRALSINYVKDEDCGAGEMLTEARQASLECQMAELVGDAEQRFVYYNARSWGCHRWEGDVNDRQSPKSGCCLCCGSSCCSQLVETGYGQGCQGSVVSFPAQPEQAGSDQEPRWLLYSHPTSRRDRVDLGVYLNRSPKQSSGWSKPWIISSGPSGYSDLAYLGDGWFACLMERGEKTYTERMEWAVFSYKDVEKNQEK